MNDQLPDKTVIMLIITTLLFVFILIFSTRPSQKYLEPSIEWREQQTISTDYIQHDFLLANL